MTDRSHAPSKSHRSLMLAMLTSSLLLALSAVATTASFTDRAEANLAGPDGIGGVYDIAIVAEDGTLADAASADDAIVVPFAPADAPFSKTLPVRLSTTVTTKPESVEGDILLSLVDPDPEQDDVFDHLRFDVTLDGRSLIVGATAAEFNAKAFSLVDARPDARHIIALAVRLDPSAPRAINGRSTAVGILFEGGTTP